MIALLIASMVLFGCTTSETGSPISITDPFLGGTRGLSMEFEKPFGTIVNNVDEVFSDDTFAVRVDVKNEGEYIVPAGKAALRLTNINRDSFSGLELEKTNPDPLDKLRSDFVDEQVISFGETVSYKGLFSEATRSWSPSMGVEMCYEYKSFATANICYKSRQNKRPGCNPDSERVFYTSGAPIIIRSVKEASSPNGFKVTVELENVGLGNMFLPGNQQCDPGENALKNRVHFIAHFGANNICEKDVRFIGNTAKVLCDVTLQNEDDNFEQAVTFEVIYDYAQRTSYIFTVRNAEEN